MINRKNPYLSKSKKRDLPVLQRLTAIIIVIVLCIQSIDVLAQELPPITNYTPSQYGADNQNWQATQGRDGVVYFANNKGLLSYNGAQWHLNSSPNETIIRSVKAINDRIYSGAHMDFGYWEKKDTGILQYTSLKDSLNIEMLEGEQIWKIIEYKGKVLLQSLNGIYVFQPNENVVSYLSIDRTNGMYRLFEIEGELYFQVETKGLFTVRDGEAVLYDDREIFKTKTFTSIFKRETGWLGVTQKDGIYRITPSEVLSWKYDAEELLKNVTVYRSEQLSDGSIALGTIAHGFIKLTKDGVLDYHFVQDKGLGNNTVLSIFEDTSNNIWVGLDNGIGCINTEEPIRNYFDYKGRLGTTYASALHNNMLYIGTNQGLFYKRKDSEDFLLVPGTDEQVWNLNLINGVLFCGHTNGTFIIDRGVQKQIGSIKGTWGVREIPGHSDLLLQGNYDGLYILQEIDGLWSIRNKVEDFDVSSRYFEFADDYKILVSNEYKGVYEIEIDSAFAKAKKVMLNPSVKKGEHSSLVKLEGSIYYGNRDGIFRYDSEISSFTKEDKMSTVYTDSYVSGKLVNANDGKLWAFTENALIYFSKDVLESNFSIGRIQIPQSLRNTAKGFENITKLDLNNFLLGTTNGYLTLEPTFSNDEFDIYINSVQLKERDGSAVLMPLSEKGAYLWEENNLTFSYHVSEFNKFRKTEYQQRLQGFYDEWSDWSSDASQDFSNIPSGDYTFEVRARIGDVITAQSATYSFTIDKPWYGSYAAFGVYALIGLLVFIGINTRNKRRYKIKQDQLLEKTKREMKINALAIEKENIELRNQNLRDDIQARNRELATSTMAMVSKSKTLNDIKGKLSKLEPSAELTAVIKSIDNNISTKEDWSFFEKAFNQADKDFFKKVKEKHPELTTNDLKLCVYLRLNMSSKEIAPLLNISHRSVEIKRYRLRKKISLARDVQLNEYFINL